MARNKKYIKIPPITRAIRKYGPENFTHEILAEANDQQSLNALENMWIHLMDSTNPKRGYNIDPFASGTGPRSLKTRIKMSRKARLRVVSDETRAKMSAARMGMAPWNKGLKLKEKKERVKKKRGKVKSTEKMKGYEGRQAYRLTPEFREKMRQASIKRWEKVRAMRNGRENTDGL